MATELHRLLRKQLKRDLGLEHIPDNLEKFIRSVNSAYFEFENDRGLMERSIDISSREYNEKTIELEKAEERLVHLVETIPQGIMIIDCHGKINFANSGVERIFGLPREELIGRKYNDHRWLFRTVGGVSLSPEDLPLNLVMRKDEPIVGAEYKVTSTDGGERILYINAAPLHDVHGNITGIVASLEDVTLRKQMEEQLKYLGLHDSLTGLYNRTFFEEEMRRLGTGRYNPVGIIICDIDGLKLVNDTLGHEQGDKLLMSAARIIKGCFREDDVVTRIGGDEFAVLLKSIPRAKVEDCCRKLRKAVEEYSVHGTEGVPFSISVGFAVSDKAIVNMANLFKEADNNMYREKLHHRRSARNAIVQTLVKAMEARDFCTEGHADRMQDLAEVMAVEIGFSERQIADVRLLAQFHDVGKVGIPDRVLFKPGQLTPEEKVEMQRHSEIGHRIAQSAIDLMPIADWILKHHEWWNGEGYPLGLKGEEIPLECRILAIVDAYDAMTSDRPYRKAMRHEEAAAELKRCAGEQFDPELTKRFLCLLQTKRSKNC